MQKTIIRALTAAAATLTALAAAALLTACASRPEAPVLHNLTGAALTQTTSRLDALLPADVLLLGEQHDAAEHQTIHSQVIAVLAQRGQLGAVALEMADAGATTAALHPSSTELQAQSALKWNNQAWPWAAYGPAIMTAVRAGVPVIGANLPRRAMRAAMGNSELENRLPGSALKAQQELIRTGHCNLLPEDQIALMTRIQIAKDISLAANVSKAVLPGKVVVLLTGSGHADRLLGVPLHLASNLVSKAVRLRAGDAVPTDSAQVFDAVWATPAVPQRDYCADFKAQMLKQ